MNDTDQDLDELNLLEWSQDLNRALLGFPFRPLRSSIDEQTEACFLYKLAHSSVRKEVGLLLLDTDACNAFYEGVSLRTLERRTRHSQTEAEVGQSARCNDSDQLSQIITAIHHALDPRTAVDKALKTTIGLESTRFSSSLSINVRSKDEAPDHNFKTSFDLDPLDHASLANMISTHFVRPLLHLADVFARSASKQQLDSIHAPLESPPTSLSDSLELLRRSALAKAQLPIGFLRPLSAQDYNTAEVMPSEKGVATHAPSATLDLDHDDDEDPDADMLFFGPPGLKPPKLTARVQKASQAKPSHERPCHSSDSDDGDRTLTVPLATTADRHTADQDQDSGSKQVANRAVLAASTDDDSNTSEEESLPLAGNGKEETRIKQPPSSPSPAAAQIPRKHERSRPQQASAAGPHAHKSPDVTPPPPSFVPSASQTSPSSRDTDREEQLRRREQIARIKRGASSSQVSDNTSNGSARPSASTRKRARF